LIRSQDITSINTSDGYALYYPKDRSLFFNNKTLNLTGQLRTDSEFTIELCYYI